MPASVGRSRAAPSATTGKYVSVTAVGRSLKTTVTERVSGGRSSRSAVSGRHVSQTERTAAARARVSADRKRGVDTEQWIVDLAETSG